MGAFSSLTSKYAKSASATREAVDRGRSLWNQAIGGPAGRATGPVKPPFPKVRDGGSWGKGVTSEPAAFKRLLQAMRSMAPGGWSDDRWEQSKHLTGIVYPAIHRKGEQLSMAEFQVFKKDTKHQDGKRPISPDDPPEGGRLVKPYQLVELLEHPNNDDSFGDLMYWWQQQMDLTGTALTWMVPNKLEAPYELYPIPTSLAIPQPAINPDYPDGYWRIQPVYPYGPFSSYPTPATAVGAPIPAQWMMRMKFPHPILRYDGYSPLSALKLHIDEVEAMDRSRWYSMNRVINPSAVLNFDEMDGAEPLPEAEIERIRAEFEADHQGPENFGRLFVAAPGSKLDKWSVPLKDMEFIDGWNQLVGFILGAGFGITKPAAGMIEDSSYSTLFATLKQLHLLTLDPFCHRVAHCLTRRIGPFFGDDLIVEVRCARIDDHDIKNAKLSLLQGALALTKNEMRKACEYPLTADAWGEEVAGQPSPPPPQPGMPGQEGAIPGMEAGGAPVAPAVPGGQEVEKDLSTPRVPKKTPADSTPKNPAPVGAGGAVSKESKAPEPPEIANSKPKPGPIARGGLKPHLSDLPATRFGKSLSRYEQIRKALLTNGEANGDGPHE